jgi:hypothetical protein
MICLGASPSILSLHGNDRLMLVSNLMKHITGRGLKVGIKLKK